MYKNPLVALQNLKSGERLEPELRDALYYSVLGGVYNDLFKYEDAIVAFNKSLELNENYFSYAGRGEARLQQKNFKGAESDFMKSLTLQKDNVMSYDGLSAVYYEKKDYIKSMEYCNKAIQTDSMYIKAHFHKAILLKESGDRDGAVAECSKVIALDSTYILAYLERASLKNGDLSDVNQALKIDPNNAEAFALRGVIEFKEGNNSKALADLDKSLELNPNIAINYSSRASIKTSTKDLKGALMDFDQAIKLEPKNPLYYFNKGLLEMNQLTIPLENTLQDFTKAIALKSDYGDAYYGRAVARFKSGDKTGACSDIQMAVKLKVKGAEEQISDICK